MPHLHHRGPEAVALAVGGVMIGAAAGALLDHATLAEKSVIFVVSVRNIRVNVAKNTVTRPLDVLLQLRNRMFHVLLRRALCLDHLLFRRRQRR